MDGSIEKELDFWKDHHDHIQFSCFLCCTIPFVFIIYPELFFQLFFQHTSESKCQNRKCRI